jgi:hypothetical protein
MSATALKIPVSVQQSRACREGLSLSDWQAKTIERLGRMQFAAKESVRSPIPAHIKPSDIERFQRKMDSAFH